MAGESAPHAPFNALGPDALVNAQALENFQRFLGVTNTPGRCPLHTNGVVLIQYHCGHTTLGQAAGQGQTRHARTDHHDCVSHHVARLQLLWNHKSIFGQGVAAALGEFVAVGMGHWGHGARLHHAAVG